MRTKKNSRKGRALALPQYLKDPAIRQLHNDTLELYRRTYRVEPSERKMRRVIARYGYKHVRYALLVIQQFHEPKKAGAFKHFQKALGRIFPSQ